jgi:ABC-type uncharacterized transport system involved in gliding motility auxiliary subunit
MNDKLLSVVGVLVAGLLFFLLNLVIGFGVTRARVDLTQDDLYTLSSGTRNILRGLDEPITLRFYYSRELAADLPPYPTYARRVEELLQEYDSIGGENIVLETIDPVPFSEAEDEAVSYRLRGLRINAAGDRLFLGLAGTNSVDDVEIIEFFDPRQEESLEYELTQLVSRLATSELPVVGLLSSLPLGGGPPAMPGQQQPQAWPVLSMIERSFQVRHLDPSLTEIADDVKVLMIVHPKDLPDAARYAIDQFALRGGRVLAFVDPFVMFDAPQAQGMPLDNASRMPDLLASWGVELDADGFWIYGDEESAENMGNLFFPFFLGLRGERLSSDDFTTRDLNSVHMFLAGAITQVEGASTTTEVLLSTGEEGGGRMPVAVMQDNPATPQREEPDLAQITDDFTPGGGPYALAVRVTGDIESAFPDGKPRAADEEHVNGEDPPPDDAEPEAAGDHLSASREPFHAIIVADADLLHHELWAQPQRFLNGTIYQPISGNAHFAVNCLENLTGNTDLISLRSRKGHSRPFTKKEELAKQAQEEYRERQEELERVLAETEAELAKLQAPVGEEAGGAIVSEARQKEIDEFNAQYVETRKGLREVRRKLNEDIEGLGTMLLVLNTLALPVLVLLLGLVVFVAKENSGRRR